MIAKILTHFWPQHKHKKVSKNGPFWFQQHLGIVFPFFHCILPPSPITPPLRPHLPLGEDHYLHHHHRNIFRYKTMDGNITPCIGSIHCPRLHRLCGPFSLTCSVSYHVPYFLSRDRCVNNTAIWRYNNDYTMACLLSSWHEGSDFSFVSSDIVTSFNSSIPTTYPPYTGHIDASINESRTEYKSIKEDILIIAAPDFEVPGVRKIETAHRMRTTYRCLKSWYYYDITISITNFTLISEPY